jgi:hypothetical protein
MADSRESGDGSVRLDPVGNSVTRTPFTLTSITSAVPLARSSV